MKLPDLLKILPEYQGSPPEVEVRFITQDARQVSPGSLYIAIRGHKVDGHQFLQNASQLGAVAFVVEDLRQVPQDFTGFVQVVEDARDALQMLASQFYGHPSQRLLTFGVTGTNGKTSITYFLEQVLNDCGYSCGVLGTIGHHLREHRWNSEMTTPDPISLQRRLAEMCELGATAVAMEVSSHALAQRRAHSVQFDRVIFTNLTQDHLDFHGSMENYFRAKKILFTDLLELSSKFPIFAIINIDDPFGRRMRVNSKAGILTYGQHRNADFRYEVQQMDFSGTEFTLTVPNSISEEPLRAQLRLIGQHNVANAVAVVATLATLGIAPEKSLQVLSEFSGVPGRLELIGNRKGVAALVDYAHTPDALENVLKALRKVRDEGPRGAKIWTVFGCGGDRDRGKRPLMGRIALQYSDYVVVTSDNPRSEKPEAIIEEIVAGLPPQSGSQVIQEVDRRRAIEMALQNAQSGDVVLIAGKGHEEYQIVGFDKIPFSDQVIVREVLG